MKYFPYVIKNHNKYYTAKPRIGIWSTDISLAKLFRHEKNAEKKAEDIGGRVKEVEVIITE